MEPTFEVMPPGRPPTRAQPPGGLKGIAVGLVVLLLKFKTALTILLSIWIYSFAWGWPFAAGLVLLIFVHEMGHVIAAKMVGIPVSAPTFIPFFGAMITMKQNPRDAWTEALMAYGGPLAGGAGGWVCWWIALQLHAPWLMAVAAATFAINLFNMIPLPPLDGGRICAAVSAWFWLLGLVLLVGAVFLFHASTMTVVIVVLVLYFALPRLKRTFLLRNSPEMQRYFGVPVLNRMLMAIWYLGLAGALLYGFWDASQYMQSVQSTGA